MDVWTSVHQAAGRNGGYLAVSAAVELGVSASAFERRAGREGWTRESRGVWRRPGHDNGRLQRLQWAVTACGPDALVTGREGLWLHGVRVRSAGVPRLVIAMDRHAARHLSHRVKLISSRTLRPVDCGTARGLPAAFGARCLVDVVIPPTPPLWVVRDLLITTLQARVVSLDDLRAVLGRTRGVPGMPVLRRAVHDVREISADSPFSDRVHRRLRRSGLHPDRAPVPVRTHDRVLHPDITFSGPRLALEVDSLAFHGSQRAVMVDGLKDRAYRAASWEPFRIGWLEFERGWDAFVADLRRAGAT